MLNPSLDAILITHFSPYTVGRLDTRISYSLPSTLRVIRPSCGFLFSEISIPDIILIRVVIAPRSVLSYSIISRRLPSILYLTRILFSIGSICISEALCLTACSITLLISCTIGAFSISSLLALSSLVSSLNTSPCSFLYRSTILCACFCPNALSKKALISDALARTGTTCLPVTILISSIARILVGSAMATLIAPGLSGASPRGTSVYFLIMLSSSTESTSSLTSVSLMSTKSIPRLSQSASLISFCVAYPSAITISPSILPCSLCLESAVCN